MMRTELFFEHEFDIGDYVVLKSFQGTKRANNIYRINQVLIELNNPVCIKSEDGSKGYNVKYQLEATKGIINSLRLEYENNLIQVAVC